VGFLLAANAAVAERALQRKKVFDVGWNEPRKAEFHFGKQVQFRGIPLPWSTGMMDLAVSLEIIYGAQQLRGKILSRKDLGLAERFLLTPLSLCR
jgi:hypothetical protein